MSYRTIAHYARSVRLTTSDGVFWLGSREQALPLQKVLISPKGVTPTDLCEVAESEGHAIGVAGVVIVGVAVVVHITEVVGVAGIRRTLHQLFAETVTITGLDPMKNSRREVFISLVVSFPNLGDKLCFVRDVLSKFLHGVVNPWTFFRILENSVIEQS